MRMQKRRFRIGELADKLNVEKFVIRFWEKEFNIKSHRSEGGQRFYEEKDYQTFKKIKVLLYDEKFTIRGAKKYLKEDKIIASKVTSMDSSSKMNNQLLSLQKQLLKLKELL